MRSFPVVFLVEVFAALAFSAPVSGQVRAIWVEARTGMLFATTDLGRTDVLGGSGFADFQRVDPAPTVGVGARLDLGTYGSVRISADVSPETAVAGEWTCTPFVACPSVLLPLRGRMSRGSVSVDAGLRLPESPLSPMVYAGLGLRWSETDWAPPAADVTLPAFSFAERERIYRLGLGVEQRIRAVAIFLEVDGIASRFGGHAYSSIEGGLEEDRALSWDIGLSGGVRVRIP